MAFYLFKVPEGLVENQLPTALIVPTEDRPAEQSCREAIAEQLRGQGSIDWSDPGVVLRIETQAPSLDIERDPELEDSLIRLCP